MRKFLSLVLALVMAMSLVTVSAGAKEFADDSSITYKEAVDVISTIGVVDGYADGSFNPSGNLTRGAAAKIICNLILGPTTAAELSADRAPYPDVPVTHEFAGYIAYCKEEGIISGYGDGTFKPANGLTGYAFIKMLLGALGYDSKIEGFVGDNWSINVAKVGLGIGLNSGLETDFNGTKLATREEAALYALNTLTAKLVEYDNPGSTITVGGVEIVTSPSKATYREYTNKVLDPARINGLGYIEFAEQYFTRLRLEGVYDAFQRPANYWTFKSDDIGTYSAKPDAKFVSNVTEADIYSEAGMTGTPRFSVWIDGIRASTYDGTFVVDGNNSYSSYRDINKGEENVKLGAGNAAVVEVFKDTSNDASPDHRICIINSYIGEVIGVEAASGKSAAYIEVGRVGNIDKAYENDTSVDVLDNWKKETTGYEVGDVVTFTYSLKSGSGSIQDIAAAEAVTGTVDNFTTDKKFTLSGENYEYGAKKVNIFGSSDVKAEATVYLDANGYALYTAESKDNIKNYALVLNAGVQNAISGSDYQAWLLYADGTTKVVATDKAYGNFNGVPAADVHVGKDGDDFVGEWVTFKTNSKGQIVLNELDATKRGDNMSKNNGVYSPTSASKIVSKNGQSQVETSSVLADVYGATANTDLVKVNSASVIIVKEGSKYTVCEGIKNMPSINTTTGAMGDYWSYYASGTYAKVLYIEVGANAKVDYGTNKTIFLISDSAATPVETDSDKYYVFKGVVDGQLVEDGISLDATDADTFYVITDLLSNNNVNYLLTGYAVDNGIYTVEQANYRTPVAHVADAVKDVEKVSGDCIRFNGDAFYTAKDCVFYRVDQYGNLQKTTINAVRNDDVGTANSHYDWMAYTTNSDGELTGVYWEYNRL